jgi:hypothetical protein
MVILTSTTIVLSIILVLTAYFVYKIWNREQKITQYLFIRKTLKQEIEIRQKYTENLPASQIWYLNKFVTNKAAHFVLVPQQRELNDVILGNPALSSLLVASILPVSIIVGAAVFIMIYSLGISLVDVTVTFIFAFTVMHTHVLEMFDYIDQVILNKNIRNFIQEKDEFYFTRTLILLKKLRISFIIILGSCLLALIFWELFTDIVTFIIGLVDFVLYQNLIVPITRELGAIGVLALLFLSFSVVVIFFKSIEKFWNTILSLPE